MISACGTSATDMNPSAPQETILMVLWAEDVACGLFCLDEVL